MLAGGTQPHDIPGLDELRLVDGQDEDPRLARLFDDGEGVDPLGLFDARGKAPVPAEPEAVAFSNRCSGTSALTGHDGETLAAEHGTHGLVREVGATRADGEGSRHLAPTRSRRPPRPVSGRSPARRSGRTRRRPAAEASRSRTGACRAARRRPRRPACPRLRRQRPAPEGRGRSRGRRRGGPPAGSLSWWPSRAESCAVVVTMASVWRRPAFGLPAFFWVRVRLPSGTAMGHRGR